MRNTSRVPGLKSFSDFGTGSVISFENVVSMGAKYDLHPCTKL